MPRAVGRSLDAAEIPQRVADDLEARLEDEARQEPSEDSSPEQELAALRETLEELHAPKAGNPARGLVRFAGVGEPGCSITFTGTITDLGEDEPDITVSIDYVEANTEDFEAGIWTNGTTAAQSAASFAAAFNGDLRKDPDPDDVADDTFLAPLRAMVLADGVTVLIYYSRHAAAISDYYDHSNRQYEITTTSSTNVKVQSADQGAETESCGTSLLSHVVTTLDVQAAQIVVPVPIEVYSLALLPWMAADGGVLNPQPTGKLTYAGDAEAADDPCRIVYTFAGATNPVAGQKLNVLMRGE